MKKNRDSKTEITIHDDPLDKRKDSVHVEEAVRNEPNDSLIVSDQVSSENIHSNNNNLLVFFGDSIPKIKNLKSRLYNANFSCHFFGGATSKQFHHFFHPTLNETEVIMDIAVLHMGTTEIINLEVNKDLVADCIINIAKEFDAFIVKSELCIYFNLDSKHLTRTRILLMQ